MISQETLKKMLEHAKARPYLRLGLKNDELYLERSKQRIIDIEALLKVK